ncbi:MAG: transposase [Planctomycetaceae bacterium]|nr:transposase [Planctomycetaceae bacterium]
MNHVIADAANDSDAIRHRVRQLRARACIRPNPTRKRKKRFYRSRYKYRNVIERFFGRSSATGDWPRDTKKAVNFAGFVWLAALLTHAFCMSVLSK